MKKMTKKLLSAFLAAVMVFTAVPVTVFAALGDAKTAPAVTELLTTGIDESLTNIGNVTWDETEHAAKFDGNGYLTLPSNPLANVTDETGFAVSLDFKKDSSNGDNGRMIDINDGTNTNTFAINGGSDNYRRACTLAKVDGTECSYWANDLANNDYTTGGGTWWLPENDKWYNLTVVMDKEGYYSYYVDGTLKGTFRSDYGTAFPAENLGHGVTAKAIKDQMAKMTQMYIGKSIYQADSPFKGYIRNVKVFNGATAKEAMSAYETLMAGDVLRTNLSAAYRDYQDASKAWDAYYYGEKSDANLTATGEALVVAMGNMKAWNEYTANNPDPADKSYKVSELAGYNSVTDKVENVLYQYGLSTSAPYTDGTSVGRIKGGMQYGAIVFLYNGTEMACPIDAYVMDDSWRDSRCRYIAPSTTGFSMLTYWRGSETKNVSGYQGSYSTGHQIGYVKGDTEHASNKNPSSNQYYTGTLVLKANSVSFSSSQYSKSYKVSYDVGDNDNSTGTFSGGGVVNQGDQTIYVINYKALVDSLKTKFNNDVKNFDVTGYKEGGLTTLFDYLDAATAFDPNSYFNGTVTVANITASTSVAQIVANAANNISTIVTNLQKTNTLTADDGRYQALRNAMRDGAEATRTLDGETITVIGAYNNGKNLGYTKDTYGVEGNTQFYGAYETARNFMANLETTGYTKQSDAQTYATALTNKFNALAHVSYAVPSYTSSDYLGVGQAATITNNESGSTLTYSIVYDGDASTKVEQEFTGDAKDVVIFADDTYTTAKVTAYVTLDGIASKAAEKNYTKYNAPKIDGLTSGSTVIGADEAISITSNNGEAAGTLYYKTEDMADYVPFTGAVFPLNDGSLQKAVYAKEINGNAVSAETIITVIRENTFTAVVSPTHEKGSNYYTSGSTLSVADTSEAKPSKKVMIQLNGTNGETYGPAEYVNPITTNSAIFSDSVLVRVTMYYEDDESNKVTKTVYNADSYEPLTYRDSFDSKTVSGTATKAASVEDGAGSYIYGGNYDRRSPDWRNNVLKLSAADSGVNLTLPSNPYSAAAAKAAAKAVGVTISFWRYMAADGNEHVASNTAKEQLSAITFYQADNKYLKLYTSADVVRKNATTAEAHINPDAQDPTQHAAGNYSGKWVHIAVTVDPDKGVTVYTNGEPHETAVETSGSFSGNNAALAAEILDFITDSNTQIGFAEGYDGSNVNIYLDDIRMYSELMTQVDINNMYTDELADVQNSMATAHDPTNVTVYTLKTAKHGKNAGDKVGVEFFNYYDDVTDDDIADLDYYSFGTGMTIYHSKDNVNWKVVGDSEGRCGYQNEDLFGQKYTVALKDALDYAKKDSRAGAGYLVWAPHVMYNITLDKWVYYGSTSSWGSQTSTVFMCVSDEPTKDYTYRTMVQKSTTAPNAIDSCVYYNADYSKLFMLYGSWGDSNGICIYVKEMNLDGTPKSNEDGSPLAAAVQIKAGREGGDAGQHNSGEGAYVVYENGYYYLYISYGQNTGSYTERVYRSTQPDSGFVGINEVPATDITSASVHGNQLLAPFDIKLYDYTYVSTGHNSIYKVKNSNNEWVTLNSVHARPYASENHGWKALQDGALATRQSENTGNVTLVNLVGYTEAIEADGGSWPVLFPLQYNGTDSIERKITAEDLEGIYTADDMRKTVDSQFGNEYTFTMLAKSETTGIAYGVKDGIEFTSYFTLKYDETKKANYITLYTSNQVPKEGKEDENVRYRGVVASQLDENGKTKVPMIGMINMYNGDEAMHKAFFGEQTWAYRSADIPDVDRVISEGDLVSSSGVIYTHASDQEVLALATINRYSYGTDEYYYKAQKNAIKNAATISTSSLTKEKREAALAAGYAVYGQEISDNYTYGQSDYASGGERFTSIAVKYPGYIDTEAVGSVISLNDTEYCRDYGETGSNMSAKAYANGAWCKKNKDGTYTATGYTDAQAKEAGDVYKVYYLTGKVSSFFRYYYDPENSANGFREADGAGVDRLGYPEVGVTLVVNYKSVEDPSANWSEFEFMYVMPNPAWGHTLAATKNDQADWAGNDRRSSYGIFNRFEGSYGEATEYSSSMLRYAATGSTNETGWGTGVSGYLTDFSKLQSENSTAANYKELNTLSKIQSLYNFYGSYIGSNAGSFAAWTHDDTAPNAYVATPQVIKVNYYVDYSDSSEYQTNKENGLITIKNGKPSGFQFKMKSSNFLWHNYDGASIQDVTSYAMNTTGLKVNYSTESTSNLISIGQYDYNADDTSKKSGVMATNRVSFMTSVGAGVASTKKTWFDDAMLFHTNQISNSNSLFTTAYRNKLLYYFSDRDVNNMQYLKLDKYESGFLNADGSNTDYVDGTDKDKTPSKVWNYYSYTNDDGENIGSTAYKIGANGKDNTNTWQGTATFTGRDRVNQNKIEDIANGTDINGNPRVYDGYYYYHTVDKNTKEDWTDSLSTARSVTNYGPLDVTAENYANYILELGNYHKISDLGASGGRFLGNETYHYYNIGVATCDKGAARDFVENFALKELVEDEDGNVVLDANGRPTVDKTKHEGDTSGNLYVQDVSAKSYRDYIDALSRLEWFVNNPQNTLQNDLADEDIYKNVKSVMDSSDEYVTAYSGEDAIYKVETTGKNVFGDGDTTTDKVQAKLIEDVITAYENLYTVEDYKEVEREYTETVNLIKKAVEGDYTTTSLDNYNEAVDALLDAVRYYTNIDGQTLDDIEDGLVNTDIYSEEYWRYSDYSGADYEDIKAAMAELRASLMPKADLTALKNTLDGTEETTGKVELVREGIYTEGVQTKRFDQWKALYGEVNNADNTYFGAAEDGVVQEVTSEARYATQGSVKYIDAVIGKNEEEKAETNYPYYVYRLAEAPTDTATAGSDTTYSTGDVYVTLTDDIGGYAVLSAEQKAVNTENYTLSGMSIEDVDLDTAYQSYDAAYDVITGTLVRDKYTAEGIALLDSAVNTRNSVYEAPTQADKDAYEAIMGTDLLPAGKTELKISGMNETDGYTATLLTASSDLENESNKATYVKRFDVSFTLTGSENDDGTTNATPYYGEKVSFNIPEDARGYTSFSVTYKDENGTTTGSAKDKTYYGEQYERIAKSNMDIAATVAKAEGEQGESYKVEVKNIYNSVIGVYYVATLPTELGNATLDLGKGSSNPTAPGVPFYTFDKWVQEDGEEAKTVSFTAHYNAEQASITINAPSGTVTEGAAAKDGAYTTSFDTLVTVDGSAIENFYAWATQIEDDGVTKYQIASYKTDTDSTYQFYAVTDETFVPVIKDGSTYKVGEIELTTANVDIEVTVDDVNVSKEALLKQKLDNKAPFVSLLGVKAYDGGKRSTAYLRVTKNSSAYSEIGVLASNKTGRDKANMVIGQATKFKTSTVLNTGQYVYTINMPNATNPKPVTYRGYIAYDISYSFTKNDGTSSSYVVNVADTSGRILTASI